MKNKVVNPKLLELLRSHNTASEEYDKFYNGDFKKFINSINDPYKMTEDEVSNAREYLGKLHKLEFKKKFMLNQILFLSKKAGTDNVEFIQLECPDCKSDLSKDDDGAFVAETGTCPYCHKDII